MYTAADMNMIDPKEYVYVLTLHNTLLHTIQRPWRASESKEKNFRTFRSVLQVRLLIYVTPW